MSVPDLRSQNSPEAARRRILVADDDGVTRALVRAALAADYEVVEARDGSEALEALASPEGFACAIFDDRMPHMSGLELAEHVRDTASLRHMPVILITARDNTVERQVQSLQAGVSAFLSKPFARVQLQRLVDLILAMRPARSTA